jgi:hypothetical protein
LRAAHEWELVFDRRVLGVLDRAAQFRGIAAAARAPMQHVPARVGRDAAHDIDEHVAAQANELVDLGLRADEEALQRKRGFGPRPIEPADVHARTQVARRDLLLDDFCRRTAHRNPAAEDAAPKFAHAPRRTVDSEPNGATDTDTGEVRTIPPREPRRQCCAYMILPDRPGDSGVLATGSRRSASILDRRSRSDG